MTVKDEYWELLTATNSNLKNNQVLRTIGLMGCSMQGKTTIASCLRGDRLTVKEDKEECELYIKNDKQDLKIQTDFYSSTTRYACPVMCPWNGE
jgi:hypothetical protein